MDDLVTRLWGELIARPDGPLAIRFYLQPAMSLLFAIRDGIADSRIGAPPYLWHILGHPEDRSTMLWQGWKSVGKVFVLAVALDLVYQVLVIGALRPVESLIVAVCLALVPYVVARGPVSRLLSRAGHVRS